MLLRDVLILGSYLCVSVQHVPGYTVKGTQVATVKTRHFSHFLTKALYFTRVLADGLGWGPVGGGCGRVNPPPVAEVLNTHDKVGGFVCIHAQCSYLCVSVHNVHICAYPCTMFISY